MVQTTWQYVFGKRTKIVARAKPKLYSIQDSKEMENHS